MRGVMPLLIVLSLGFAPAPVAKDAGPTRAQADSRALQGRWERTSCTFDGKEMGGRGGNVRVAGDKVSFFLGDRLRDEWSISLKPEEKDGGRFEAKVLAGDAKGGAVNGAYRREGDVLILSYQMTVTQGLLGTSERIPIVLAYKRKRP